MKHLSTQALRIASLTGISFGAFALVALAGSWTAPTCTPPGCNADAPINTGASHQMKLGSLSLNTSTSGPDTYGFDVFGISRFFGNVEIGTVATPKTIKIVDGNQAAGKVLVSGADGTASWGSAGGTNKGVIAFTTPGSQTWTVPAGVTQVIVEAWGGGGGGAGNNCNGTPGTPGVGGGSGSYGKSILTVTPGTSIPIVVGAGGSGSQKNGGSGGTSSFASLSSGGGQGASNCSTVGSGGTSNGLVNISGQPGNGAAGGTAPLGGSGGDTSLTSGGAGVAPGGAGGAGTAVFSQGGAGAVGRVVVWY